MNPTEKNQPQDEEVLKNQEAAEAAIDEETQKEATEELNAEEKVNKELAEAQKTIEEQHDKYLRLSAEFDNYRKRTAKERLELILTASEDVIKGMLPVLDDCQRALRTLEQLENPDPSSVEGVNLIYSKLLGYLQGKGLKIIEAKGKALDTDYHCAVAKTPVNEKKMKGKIVDVVLEGYMLNGKVIRFANVVVGE